MESIKALFSAGDVIHAASHLGVQIHRRNLTSIHDLAGKAQSLECAEHSPNTVASQSSLLTATDKTVTNNGIHFQCKMSMWFQELMKYH